MCQKNKCNCETNMSQDLIAAIVLSALFMPLGSYNKPNTTINIYTDKSVEVKNG